MNPITCSTAFSLYPTLVSPAHGIRHFMPRVARPFRARHVAIFPLAWRVMPPVCHPKPPVHVTY